MLGMTWERTLNGALDEISRTRRAPRAASEPGGQRAPCARSFGVDVKILAGIVLGVTGVIVWMNTWHAFMGWALSRGDASR